MIYFGVAYFLSHPVQRAVVIAFGDNAENVR